MASPGELLDDARNTLQRPNGSLGDIAATGIGGFLLAIATVIISGITTVGDLIIQPIRALAAGLVTAVQAFFVAPLGVVLQGALTARVSIAPGQTFAIGPFTLIVGLVTVLAFFYILAVFLTERETSNVIPGAPFDLDIWPFREEEASEED